MSLTEMVRELVLALSGLGVDLNGVQKPGYHKRTFERYVQPSFDTFKKIHENYVAILVGSLAKLRFPNGTNERAIIIAVKKKKLFGRDRPSKLSGPFFVIKS